MVGKILYGEPSDFIHSEMECSAEEFYALPSERYKISPKYLSHNNIAFDDIKKRNLFIDLYREKIYKHNSYMMTIINGVLIVALLIFGSGIQYIDHLIHHSVQKVEAKYEARKRLEQEKKTLKDRIASYSQQAVVITNQYKANKINKEMYQIDITNLKANYKDTENQLKQLEQGDK